MEQQEQAYRSFSNDTMSAPSSLDMPTPSSLEMAKYSKNAQQRQQAWLGHPVADGAVEDFNNQEFSPVAPSQTRESSAVIKHSVITNTQEQATSQDATRVLEFGRILGRHFAQTVKENSDGLGKLDRDRNVAIDGLKRAGIRRSSLRKAA